MTQENSTALQAPDEDSESVRSGIRIQRQAPDMWSHLDTPAATGSAL